MIYGVGVGEGLGAARGHRSGAAWNAGWNIIIHSQVRILDSGDGQKGRFLAVLGGGTCFALAEGGGLHVVGRAAWAKAKGAGE